MKPGHIKKLLMSAIKNVASEPHNYCSNPDTDFIRNRKLSMESRCLTNELLDLFHASAQTPTASAFIQQRSKIKPTAFETIFKNFSKELMTLSENAIPVFAILAIADRGYESFNSMAHIQEKGWCFLIRV